MVHVIGEILVDIIVDKEKEVFAGGAPFNVASNIKHYGGNVSFYGAVGKDEYGLFLKKYARKIKFNKLILSTRSSRDTTQAIVTLDNGERHFRFNRDNGADYTLSVKKLEDLNIQKGDIVHIGSLMLSETRGRKFFYKAVKFAKDRGARISFDVNYRDDIFDNESQARRIFKNAIKEADYLKFSDEELFILSKKKRLETCLKSLLNDNQTAFVSLGKKGSLVYQGGIKCQVPTFEVKPIDTTGAGDAFYSYILYSLDNGELDYKKALISANAVGAIATQKKGATGVVPSLEELEAYLKERSL